MNRLEIAWDAGKQDRIDRHNAAMKELTEGRMEMLIELHKDFVIINNVIVHRPERIKRKDWLKWWEDRT